MKKLLVLLLSLIMVVTVFAGCGGEKLVVGITDFAPMDYKDDNGEWIGFDADMAKAFGEYVGRDVEFQLIDWDNKVFELDSGAIDVVWNGMTLTDEVKAAMDCSNPYCTNGQVVVVKKADAEKYQTTESLKNLDFAVETTSAGAEQAEALGLKYTNVADQATALAEVKSGQSDAAIIDLLMAVAMVGEGTGYEDLAYTLKLNSEEYGVGFKKGSELTEKLNEFFKKSYEDGTMQELAKTYKIEDAIIPQK